MTEYESVIGLEVHAQLLSKTKMFCGCSTTFGAPPNSHVCAVCLGLPGALPVPNEGAIRLAVRAAIALGCEVRQRSQFARKNYFYPDLAKGYQISQFELPLNEHGALEIDVDGAKKVAQIVRIHVEEDAAKNLHGVGAGTDTLVDYNRAGTPLIEIVGAPDLRSPAEAEAYLKALREVLIFAGVNDGNLEEGSFRCDANVSVRARGASEFGTRVEIKNINSFRFVKKAIEFEITRQIALVSSGGKVSQETRTWSDAQSKTLPLRSKEEAHDYRYFPDPDLPELVLDSAWIDEIRATAPERADSMRARWQSSLGLTAYDAQVLTGHPEVARYFERVATALVAATKLAPPEAGKRAANFVQSEVLRGVETDGLRAKFPAPPEDVAALLALVHAETISGKMAKDVFAEMAATGAPPGRIVERKGLAQVSDTSVIEAAAREVLAKCADEVEKYRAGKTALLGFFVGQVMKATRGAGKPAAVNDVVKKLLEAP